MTLGCWKSQGWTGWAIALFSLAPGSLITARVTQVNQAKADNYRIF